MPIWENIISSIIFEPWIGSKFRGDNRFGVRVLVVGESHYGYEDETRPTVTTEVVRRLAQSERHSFFTKVSKVLLGLDKDAWLDNSPRSEIWEHVAFYNYIQSFVSTGPRVRPTAKMWAAAEAPFREVVTRLAPNVVLVLGKDLASHLPPLPQGIEVCAVQHPSTGFVYGRWNPVFAGAVRRAATNG